jgi:hypothetical protein
MKTLIWIFALTEMLAMLASRQPEVQEASSHDGVVVSAGEGKLVMTDTDGKEHSHSVGPATTISVYGKPGKLEDLKPAMRIRVILDDKFEVRSISTLDSDKRPNCPDVPSRSPIATQ